MCDTNPSLFLSILFQCEINEVFEKLQVNDKQQPVTRSLSVSDNKSLPQTVQCERQQNQNEKLNEISKNGKQNYNNNLSTATVREGDGGGGGITTKPNNYTISAVTKNNNKKKTMMAINKNEKTDSTYNNEWNIDIMEDLNNLVQKEIKSLTSKEDNSMIVKTRNVSISQHILLRRIENKIESFMTRAYFSFFNL